MESDFFLVRYHGLSDGKWLVYLFLYFGILTNLTQDTVEYFVSYSLTSQ